MPLSKSFKKIPSYCLWSVLILTCILSSLVFLHFVNVGYKYGLYITIFVSLIIIFINIDNNIIKSTSVIFVLIFIEGVVVYRREFFTVFSVGISVIFALLFLFTRKGGWQRLGVLYAEQKILSAFLLVSFFSIFFTESINLYSFLDQVKTYQIYYIEFFLFFLVGYLAFDGVADFKKILVIFVVFCVFSAIAHLFSVFTGINLEAVRGAEAVVKERDLSITGGWRYGGFLGNPNYMAALYVMIVPSVLMLLQDTKRYLLKIVLIVMIIIVLLSLFMTGSRGGMLFMFVNVSLFIVLHRASISQKTITLLLLAATIAMAYLFLEKNMSDFFRQSYYRFSEINHYENIRWFIWKASLVMSIENPFGLGLDKQVFGDILYSEIGVYFEHPHNAYLSVLVFNGIAGFLLFFYLVFRPLFVCVKNIYEKKLREFSLSYSSCSSILIGFLLCSITNGTFLNSYKINHIFGFFLGVIVFLSTDISCRLHGRPHQNDELVKFG